MAKKKKTATELVKKTECSHIKNFGFCKFGDSCFELNPRKQKRNTKNIKNFLDVDMIDESVLELFQNIKQWRLTSHYGFIGLVPNFRKLQEDSDQKNIFIKFKDFRLPFMEDLKLNSVEEKKCIFIDYEKKFKEYLSGFVDLVSTEFLDHGKKCEDSSKTYINVQFSNDWQKKAGTCNRFTFFVSNNDKKLESLYCEKRDGEMSIGVLTIHLIELSSINLKTKIIKNNDKLKIPEELKNVEESIEKAINKKEFIHYHLSSVIKTIKNKKKEFENLENRFCCILVEYWPDQDMIVCSLTGGKRDLGETELEAEIRENREELGNDDMRNIFSDSNVCLRFRAGGQNEFTIRELF